MSETKYPLPAVGQTIYRAESIIGAGGWFYEQLRAEPLVAQVSRVSAKQIRYHNLGTHGSYGGETILDRERWEHRDRGWQSDWFLTRDEAMQESLRRAYSASETMHRRMEIVNRLAAELIAAGAPEPIDHGTSPEGLTPEQQERLAEQRAYVARMEGQA